MRISDWSSDVCSSDLVSACSCVGSRILALSTTRPVRGGNVCACAATEATSNANVRTKRWSIIGRSAATIDFGGLLRAGGRRFERRHRLRAMNQLCTTHFRNGTDTGVIISHCLIVVVPTDSYA